MTADPATEELSEEDEQLKSELEMLVERILVLFPGHKLNAWGHH
jgi:hypothetical protein